MTVYSTVQKPTFTPVASGLLQRSTSTTECDECREKREGTLQRAAINSSPTSEVPLIVNEVLRLPGQPLDPRTRAFKEPRSGHDFSTLRVHTNAKAAGSGKVVNALSNSAGQFMPQAAPTLETRFETRSLFSRESSSAAQGLGEPLAPPRLDVTPRRFHMLNGKSDCSPTWFGDTSPEVDPAGGSFTGRLIVKYNDAVLKDPCVRDCVEVHENVHVKHLTPIVKKIAECDKAAGSNWDKKGQCNAMASRELQAIRNRSECEAYQKSFTCLTLKVLDSNSPCSKPPHRDEVQKHRGYDGCEMKRYCADAGTPEAGIPNV
jgi:hypothetical protein